MDCSNPIFVTNHIYLDLIAIFYDIVSLDLDVHHMNILSMNNYIARELLIL